MENKKFNETNNIDNILKTIEDSSIYKSKPQSNPVKKNKSGKLHANHRKRLDSKIEKYGFDSLNEYEQLEYILYVVRPRIDTNEIAHLLIDEFGSLSAVLSTSAKKLQKVEGVGYRTASFISQLNVVSGIVLRSHEERKKVNFSNQSEMIGYIQTFYIGKKHEVVYIFILDRNNNLIKIQKISDGNNRQTEVYVNKIMMSAMENHAASIVIAHNHPSGNSTPSPEDVSTAHYLREVLGTVGINLLDNVIVSDNNYYSFKEDKYFEKLIWMKPKVEFNIE